MNEKRRKKRHWNQSIKIKYVLLVGTARLIFQLKFSKQELEKKIVMKVNRNKRKKTKTIQIRKGVQNPLSMS